MGGRRESWNYRRLFGKVWSGGKPAAAEDFTSREEGEMPWVLPSSCPPGASAVSHWLGLPRSQPAQA
jgi:hypothetical protein